MENRKPEALSFAPGTVRLGVVCGLLAATMLGAGPTPAEDAKTKPKKPKLEMRALPRIGIAPVEVLAIASLVEGDDLEEFYCPELEWEWDDDAMSLQEIDCPPFEPGMKIERLSGCCNPVYFAMTADGGFVTSEKGLARIKVYDPKGEFVGVVAGPSFLVDDKKLAKEACADCRVGAGFDVAVDERGWVHTLDPFRKTVRSFRPTA